MALTDGLQKPRMGKYASEVQDDAIVQFHCDVLSDRICVEGLSLGLLDFYHLDPVLDVSVRHHRTALFSWLSQRFDWSSVCT